MPLYEYECGRCGRFELVQKFSDAALTACPTCSGPVQKLLSAPAIQFKGSGWYITDYARKSSGEGKGKSGESPSGAKEGGSSSSDAKSTSKESSAPAATSPGKKDSGGTST